MINAEDAKIIASRGGGMVLDASKYTPDDLKIMLVALLMVEV